MELANIFSLLGGLALFLYGMQMMSSGLEAAAGNKMKSIFQKLFHLKQTKRTLLKSVLILKLQVILKELVIMQLIFVSIPKCFRKKRFLSPYMHVKKLTK